MNVIVFSFPSIVIFFLSSIPFVVALASRTIVSLLLAARIASSSVSYFVSPIWATYVLTSSPDAKIISLVVSLLTTSVSLLILSSTIVVASSLTSNTSDSSAEIVLKIRVNATNESKTFLFQNLP